MKRIIQIAISVLLLGLLIYWTDLNQVQNSLSEANYWYLLLAILVITFNRFLMAGKWGILLKAKNIRMNIFDLTKIYYIANFLGLFLPPTVGTDIVRAYYVIKKDHSKVDVISSIIVERILGFLTLFFAALAGFILFLGEVAMPQEHADNLFIIILALALGGSVIFLLSLNDNFTNRMLKFLQSFEKFRFIKKIVSKIEKLIESYRSYKNHKSALTIFLVLTFLEIFTVILWSYISAIALNVNIPFTYFIAFIPILLVLVRLPFTIDGFGLNEGSYVYFLSLIGIVSSVAFSVGFITHIVTIIGILPGGVLYALNKDVKKVDASSVN